MPNDQFNVLPLRCINCLNSFLFIDLGNMRLHFQIFLAGIQSKIHKYIDSDKEMKEMGRNGGKYRPESLCQID